MIQCSDEELILVISKLTVALNGLQIRVVARLSISMSRQEGALQATIQEGHHCRGVHAILGVHARVHFSSRGQQG